MTSPMLGFSERFRFSPDADATRVPMTAVVEPHGVFRLLTPHGGGCPPAGEGRSSAPQACPWNTPDRCLPGAGFGCEHQPSAGAHQMLTPETATSDPITCLGSPTSPCPPRRDRPRRRD